MSEAVVLANALSSNTFYKELEVLVTQHNLNYVDAVVHFCEKHEIEIETAAAMIRSNQRIKSSIQIEGEELNLLPRTPRLPI